MALSFTVAVSRYFGRKEGETLSEFQNEIRQLTPKDKEELKPMLAEALGEPVE
jgi:hypothetical protein